MKPFSALATLTFMALSGSGCTTVVNGFNDSFDVITTPPGATVTTTLEGRETGCEPTPCEFSVSRKDSFIARVEKPGFHPVRIIVRTSEFRKAEIDDMRTLSAEGKDAGILPSDVAMVLSSSAFTAGAIEGGNASLYALLEPIIGLNAGITVFYGAPFTAGIDSVTGSQQSLYPNPVSLILIPETIDVPDSYKLRRLPEDTLTFTNIIESETETDVVE